jgi:hypothetical protein
MGRGALPFNVESGVLRNTVTARFGTFWDVLVPDHEVP